MHSFEVDIRICQPENSGGFYSYKSIFCFYQVLDYNVIQTPVLELTTVILVMSLCHI